MSISHYLWYDYRTMSDNVLSADNQQERPNRLNPWYITGFTEGEGTFHIAIYRDDKMKCNFKFIPEFHINQSMLRRETLDGIKKYFGCGYIKSNHRRNIKDDTQVFVVRNRADLENRIIPFFKKYPLLSNKQKTFLIFEKIVRMLSKGKHHTKIGAKYIIKLAYSMNKQGAYRRISLKDLLDDLESSETIRQIRPKGGKI